LHRALRDHCRYWIDDFCCVQHRTSPSNFVAGGTGLAPIADADGLPRFGGRRPGQGRRTIVRGLRTNVERRGQESSASHARHLDSVQLDLAALGGLIESVEQPCPARLPKLGSTRRLSPYFDGTVEPRTGDLVSKQPKPRYAPRISAGITDATRRFHRGARERGGVAARNNRDATVWAYRRTQRGSSRPAGLAFSPTQAARMACIC
jgi:hypothetical protein